MSRTPPASPAAADESMGQTRPASLWPEQPQTLDTAQAGFVLTAFDPQRAETARQRVRVAGQLAVCQPGLSLRLLLAVQGAVALAVAATAAAPAAALLHLPGPAAGALAGALAWLALVCGLRHSLAGWPLARVRQALWLLGGLCGLAGWALPAALGLAPATAWSALLAAGLGATLAAVASGWLGLREAAARPIEAHARLAELQSRIRPHFLFNALNTALVLVQLDPQRAETVLEDLSALFRAALAETGASVSLDEELDLAQRYLAIEKVRFASRLVLEWDLDAAANEARLPPLVLQPLVENAVRHGVEPAGRGGCVLVRTRAQRGMVEIEVVNTLPDSPGQPGHGIALANVRERLRLLHDVAADLRTWVDDNGHHARISVPL